MNSVTYQSLELEHDMTYVFVQDAVPADQYPMNDIDLNCNKGQMLYCGTFEPGDFLSPTLFSWPSTNARHITATSGTVITDL